MILFIRCVRLPSIALWGTSTSYVPMCTCVPVCPTHILHLVCSFSSPDSEAGKKIYCGMAFCLALELCTAVFNRCLGQLELIEGSSSSTAQAPLVEGSQQTRNNLIQECANTGQGSLTSPQSFDSLPSHPDAPCLTPTLGSTAVLLPAVKLWFDWLACQQDFWTSFLPVVDKRTLYVIVCGYVMDTC